uniref:Uncharacterized protein n=1 Tax=Glossina brevipalpis TaxID=37001 RepID=A0A1A9X2M2_9MUSC
MEKSSLLWYKKNFPRVTIYGAIASSFLFRKYYNLWAFDKETICDKFVDRGVPLVQLDEKFAFYANIIEELQQLPTTFNIQCIRLNLKPLLDSICQHAQEWCTTLGEKLAAKNVKNIDKMRLEIKELSTNLNRATKELSDFKLVMQTIDTIQTTTLTKEVKIREMQETYTTLSEHRILVSSMLVRKSTVSGEGSMGDRQI